MAVYLCNNNLFLQCTRGKSLARPVRLITEPALWRRLTEKLKSPGYLLITPERESICLDSKNIFSQNSALMDFLYRITLTDVNLHRKFLITIRNPSLNIQKAKGCVSTKTESKGYSLRLAHDPARNSTQMNQPRP